MNKLYQILWIIAPFIIRYYLKKRARKNPDYLLHWNERFGKPYVNPVQNAIWIHAVSVGETRAAIPLIEALQNHFPNTPLLMTQMTPTGRQTAQQLYPNIQCRYLPYDKTDWVEQFLREHCPKFGVIMETEIWANLFQAASREKIPLFLANARLSKKSQKGYLKAAKLFRPALATLAGCFAQTQDDAQRLREIGAANVNVLGNTKYDIIPAKNHHLVEQFRQWVGNRRVVVAASLREKDGVDEAELILQQWQSSNDTLLVLVPRHLERFSVAFEWAQQYGFKTQKRSENQAVLPETQVWIGDSMGEMFAYYQLADVVFVGGSLVETGCQNIIEPMSCGKVVLFGQSIYNFQAACEGALLSGAARQVQDAADLVKAAIYYLSHADEGSILAKNALQFVAQHQGASERMALAIVEVLQAHQTA